MNRSAETGQTWLRRSGTTTYRLNPVTGKEEIVLREEPVGTTWEVDYGVDPGRYPDRIVYTISSYDSTRTVRGAKYFGVLHLSVEVYDADFQGGSSDLIATGDIYYARGIGMIEEQIGARESYLDSFTVANSRATSLLTEEEPTGSTIGGTMYLELDNNPWVPRSVAFSPGINGVGGLIQATDGIPGVARTLDIRLANLDTGTYELSSSVPSISYAHLFSRDTRSIDGKLVITAQDEERIEGSFWFDGNDGSYIANGRFRVER